MEFRRGPFRCAFGREAAREPSPFLEPAAGFLEKFAFAVGETGFSLSTDLGQDFIDLCFEVGHRRALFRRLVQADIIGLAARRSLHKTLPARPAPARHEPAVAQVEALIKESV